MKSARICASNGPAARATAALAPAITSRRKLRRHAKKLTASSFLKHKLQRELEDPRIVRRQNAPEILAGLCRPRILKTWVIQYVERLRPDLEVLPFPDDDTPHQG